MSLSLSDFYAELLPFLSGTRGLVPTRQATGPSPSGDESFAFYRVLVERNLWKVLREVYGPLRALVLREDPEAWNPLVREYEAAHPPGGRHPVGFGEAFCDFLVARRERQPTQPVIYEELADFLWVRQHVWSAPDGDDDGFERRLFVRQYTYRVHDFVAAMERDATAPVPAPQPVLLLVYRHWRTLHTRLFLPSAAGLVALAHRQGAAVPEPLRAITPQQVQEADDQLVAHGVLGPRSK